MKIIKFLCAIAFLLGIKTSIAQESDHTITVKISNIKSDKGFILIGLYSNSSDFLNTPYKAIRTKAKTQGMEVIFKGIPKGEYAVSLFHDQDSNNKLNTLFGIPTEDYGTSNNVKGRFGPPKWKDAKFELRDKNITQTISL